MISAAIMAYNEECNIPGLMETLEGIDDIVIVDNGSTDRTVELARSLGANVIDMGRTLMEKYVPKEGDILAFREKFGWEPTFDTTMGFADYSEIRNFAASLTKHDWVFAIDCDERVEWQLEPIKELLANEELGFEVVTYYNHHTEHEILFHQKLYRKSKAHWIGWYHEFIYPIGNEPLKKVTIHDGMRTVHYQRPRSYRSKALASMEFMNIFDPSMRSLFHLGREYGGVGQHEKAAEVLGKFIDSSDEEGLVNEALLLQGISYHTLGFTKKARELWLRAVDRNPDFKDPLRLLAKTAEYEHHKVRWQSFADVATNDGVFFDRNDDFWKDAIEEA